MSGRGDDADISEDAVVERLVACRRSCHESPMILLLHVSLFQACMTDDAFEPVCRNGDRVQIACLKKLVRCDMFRHRLAVLIIHIRSKTEYGVWNVRKADGEVANVDKQWRRFASLVGEAEPPRSWATASVSDNGLIFDAKSRIEHGSGW